MTNTNWGRDYPDPNFGRDYGSPNFGRDLGGTNFGRGTSSGEVTAPPRAWYSTRALATRPANTLSYLRLSDPFGSVAADVSGNGRTGTCVNVALQEPGIGDGLTAMGLNGTSSYISWYSTSLRDAFNGALWSLNIWAKIPPAVWLDGTSRRIAILRVNTSNQISLRRTTSNNQLEWSYSAGGTANTILRTTDAPVDWFCLGFSGNKASDRLRAYYNGVQIDEKSGLGTFAGTLASTSCCLGATTTAPLNVLNGSLAHAQLWNAELTPAEFADLGVV